MISDRDIEITGNNVDMTSTVEIRRILSERHIRVDSHHTASDGDTMRGLLTQAVMACVDESSSLRPLLQYMDSLLTADRHEQLLNDVIEAMGRTAIDSPEERLLREMYRFLLSRVQSLTDHPGEWLVQAANSPSETR